MSQSVIQSVDDDIEMIRKMFGRSSRPSRINSSSVYSGGNAGGSGLGGARQYNSAQNQYRANRDTVYTAIRPGALKAASQDWQVGFYNLPDSDIPRPNKIDKSYMSRTGYEGAPDFVKKHFRKDTLQTIDHHSIYDLMEDPNDFMDGWSTIYCTYFSIELTGRSFWLINPNPARPSGIELYYLPSHWVRPMHEPGNLFGKWEVRPGGGEGFEVENENMVYMAMPNPASPIDTYASLQSQARAVNIEDQILNCQYEGLNNGIHPSVVLKAGRLPNMPPSNGNGELPILTPDQRKQLITAVALATAGPLNHREPFIVDGLIEDVIPYSFSQAEMDFPSSTKITQDRIMAGFGTNPYVTGQIENANRATATVAENSANSLQINPVINLISRAASRRIAPLFDGEISKVKIWIEEAKSTDPDLLLSRVALAPEIIPKGAMRKYMMTGELVIPELDDDEELIAPAEDEGFGNEFDEQFGGKQDGGQGGEKDGDDDDKF